MKKMLSHRSTWTRYIGIAAIGLVAAGSRPIAADDPSPSWRNGVSIWNGSGYDLADSDSKEPLPVSQRNEKLDEPPYVVPAIPSDAAVNPYFSPEPPAASPDVPTPRMGKPYDPPPISTKTSQTPSFELNPAIQSDSDALSNLTGTTTDPGVSEESKPAPPPAKPPETGKSASESSAEPSSDAGKSLELAGPAESVEQPPLHQETIRWYQYPRRWMRGWDSHAEFGIDGSDGNANTLAIQTGLEMKRKTDLHIFAIDIDYRQARSNNTTRENNGRMNIDYDRLIADSKWSGFGKLGLEWDQFKAFDLRLNLNGGLGYHWIQDEDASLVTRFGAGASREFGAPVDEWTPEGVFGIDAERQLNSRNKVKAKVDYFPAWEDFGDYRIVADASWEILLDDTDNLSLKLAVTDRYDSTPQGAKPNDVYYSLLLLYKF